MKTKNKKFSPKTTLNFIYSALIISFIFLFSGNLNAQEETNAVKNTVTSNIETPTETSAVKNTVTSNVETPTETSAVKNTVTGNVKTPTETSAVKNTVTSNVKTPTETSAVKNTVTSNVETPTETSAVKNTVTGNVGTPTETSAVKNTVTSDENHTIFLEKTFPVYTYEGKDFTINEYKVAPSDTLDVIIEKQRLPNTAETKEIIHQLNAHISDFSQLKPNEIILLPTSAEKVTQIKTTADENNEKTAQEIEYRREQKDQSDAQVTSAQEVTKDENTTIQTYKDELNNAEEKKASDVKASDVKEVKSSTTAMAQIPSGNVGPIASTSSGTVYRTVKIQKGDTLERLLRREGMDPQLIYKHLLKITKELNPELKNTNLIFTGAELRIPASGEYLANFNIDLKKVEEKALKAAEGKPSLVSEEPVKTETILAENKTDEKSQVKEEIKKEEVKVEEVKKEIKKETLLTNLPPKNVLAVHHTLNTVFTRLGENVSARGHVLLPLPGDKQLDIDAIQFPIINLQNGKYVILDTQAKLSPETLKALKENYPQYAIFNTLGNETLKQTLDRLWVVCGYYKVYKKGEAYEGGADVILSIDADWLIWPTAAAWNAGQPFAVNLANSEKEITPAPWNNFLTDHGIKVVDIYKNNIVNDNKTIIPTNNIKSVAIDTQNPNKMAKQIVTALGGNPQSVSDLGSENNQLILTENTLEPIFWETEKNKNLIEFGALSEEKAAEFRNKGYKIISSQTDDQSILRSVLYGFNLNSKNTFLIPNEGGGPSMSLIILGQSFTYKNKNYLFTSANLPANVSLLNPKLDLTILKHSLPMPSYVKPKTQQEPKSEANKTAVTNKKPEVKKPEQGPNKQDGIPTEKKTTEEQVSVDEILNGEKATKKEDTKKSTKAKTKPEKTEEKPKIIIGNNPYPKNQ